jgi:hypothetical protein
MKKLIKARRQKWKRLVACAGKMRNAYNFSIRKSDVKGIGTKTKT